MLMKKIIVKGVKHGIKMCLNYHYKKEKEVKDNVQFLFSRLIN